MSRLFFKVFLGKHVLRVASVNRCSSVQTIRALTRILNVTCLLQMKNSSWLHFSECVRVSLFVFCMQSLFSCRQSEKNLTLLHGLKSREKWKSFYQVLDRLVFFKLVFKVFSWFHLYVSKCQVDTDIFAKKIVKSLSCLEAGWDKILVVLWSIRIPKCIRQNLKKMSWFIDFWVSLLSLGNKAEKTG